MNYITNKIKSLASLFCALAILVALPVDLSAEIVTNVPWTGAPGEFESFIMNDVDSDGEQNADVYVLESNKVYFQVVQLDLHSSCEIRGAEFDESNGEYPATIQQFPGSDGTNQFTGWPASNIRTYGEGQVYKLHNLLFNGMMVDGSVSTFGVLVGYGEYNDIIIDNVTSVNNQVISYMSMGHMLGWEFTNNTAVQYTSYAGGMYFGGFFWGGGSWIGGPLKHFIMENNTVEGTWGNPLVFYDNTIGDRHDENIAIINHNTFVNASTEITFYRFGNNTSYENNLFVNMNAALQTKNSDNTTINLPQFDFEKGHGKMVYGYQQECNNEELLEEGDCWDNNNRNITYKNNVWLDTPELIGLYGYEGADGWCYDYPEPVYDDDGYQIDEILTTRCDTALAVADQSKWIGDSTIAQLVNGISDISNINDVNIGLNLDPLYIERYIERSKEWVQVQSNLTTWEDYQSNNLWMYHSDENPLVVGWPLDMDFSYSTSSAAYSHGEDGYPVGDLNVFPDKKAQWLNEEGPSHIFISEFAEGSSNNKYFEIYNGTGSDVDLSEYSLSSCSNGCDEEGVFDHPNIVTFESGTIVSAGDVYVIAHAQANEAILARADFTGFFVSNGNDFFALTRVGSGAVVDKVGDFGGDPGSGSGWDVAGVSAATKDHTLVRRNWVDQGNNDWAESAGISAHETEWIVLNEDNWSYLGSHTRDDVDAFELVGRWKMAPIMGALKVGPFPDDGGYWSSSEGDIEARSCFFDDEYVFTVDGSFQNVLGDATWNETWQDGVMADGCGAPVSPHNGGFPAMFIHDIDENKITLNGTGAFLGIAKAITGGELSNEGTELPASRTYDLYPAHEPNMMNLVISTGGGYWTFKMVNSEWTPAPIPTIDITFNLDMSEAGTINPEGVSIAGGALFGAPGDNVMTQVGDFLYTVTLTKPEFSASNYTFLNGVSDWNQKENIAEQECADEDNWNDRYLEWGDENIVVNACFGFCGDGTCLEIQTVNFVKDDDADPMLLENQDEISENVRLTRGNRGWLYNAAQEDDYNDFSPAGTHWAFGPTSLQPQTGVTYGFLRNVVENSVGGFAYVVGNTYSLHVLDTDQFFDVTFHSWTQGQNGGGVEYSRIEVDPPSLGFTSYSLSLSDYESYSTGNESSLPSYNVDGDGLMVSIEFETSDEAMGPYIGAIGVFWDANFNGTLDTEDVNVLTMGDPEDPFDNNEAPVLLVVDNGPEDENDEVGKFRAHLYDLDFLETQGATFFFSEVDVNGVVSDSPAIVQPFSLGDTRFNGTAFLSDDNNETVSGVFIDVQGIYSYVDELGYDVQNYYDAGFGVTGAEGTYDIGSILFNGGGGFVAEIEASLPPDKRRLFALVGSQDEGYNNPIINNDIEIGGTNTSNISVIEHNTLVQGYVLNDEGNPLPQGVVYGLTVFEDGFSTWNVYQTEADGYYNIWSTNGEEVWLYYINDNDDYFISDNFLLDATLNDEGLNAFVYNHNISSTELTAVIGGYAFYTEWNDNAEIDTTFLDGVQVEVYSTENYFSLTTDGNGYFDVEVPVTNDGTPTYYVSVEDTIPGLTNYGYFYETSLYPDEVDIRYIEFYPYNQYYTVSGYVYDNEGHPLYDASVDVSSIMTEEQGRDHDTGWNDWTYTDSLGYYSISVPMGFYDISVSYDGFLNEWAYGVDVRSDITIDFTMFPVGEFSGGVQGVVSYVGQYVPEEPAYINVWNDAYDTYTYADENGFYYVDLVDGIYDIYVDAPGYDSYYMSEAFEIVGNTVIYDVELFEYGFAGPPQMVDLHDVANDQGRQMRAVWDAGMPGDWSYFTQFSIWRKVNNAPIELWDYIETVPWHGMDPYAAVVPTLGDSSMHGMHMSTFMVTAHTEDVAFWLDSEPMSGYSIDNLHPEAPMSLTFSTNPGSVSLTWSSPVDEDFSYFNIYRQDILTNEPAMVFTTTDSFYVDQELDDVGACEYWVTAVDMSGLESDASSIVSAVLSSEEVMSMPTEFALKQNYPNPFNPSTQIQYALPSESMVVISIYDITGRKIRTLVNEVQGAGHRAVMWNATNEIGRPVSAGMYIYTIQAGDFIQNRKMVFMK